MPRTYKQKNLLASRLFTTTEGRARLPDLIQLSLSEKCAIGFHRYGRAVGGLVPMEAIRMLAGCEEFVDRGMQETIRRCARELLAQSPGESERLLRYLTDHFQIDGVVLSSGSIQSIEVDRSEESAMTMLPSPEMLDNGQRRQVYGMPSRKRPYKIEGFTKKPPTQGAKVKHKSGRRSASR